MEKQIDYLEKEIAELEMRIKPLAELMEKRKDQLNRKKSEWFIVKNKITKDSVQRCDEEGMPWMGDIYKFGEWMSEGTIKPWCCWNGFIYKTADIIEGKMDRYPMGRYENLV